MPHLYKREQIPARKAVDDALGQWREDEADSWRFNYSDPYSDDDLDPTASAFSEALVGFVWQGDLEGLLATMATCPELDLDAPGQRHDVPLHTACIQGHLDCAKALLDAGASPCVLDRSGISPLDMAVISSHDHSGDLCRLLASRGAPIDQVDLKGLTPYLLACSRANLSAAAALFELGANRHAMSPKRESAYDLAWNARMRRSPRSQSRSASRDALLDWLESLELRDELLDMGAEPHPVDPASGPIAPHSSRQRI
jgi:hypothetical protein